MDLQRFNSTLYLEDKNILFHTEGKNVTEGWINIECLWCDDPSHHLGISPSNLYHCWRCGLKGSAIDIVMKVENCSYGSALIVMENYEDYLPGYVNQEEKTQGVSRIKFPSDMKDLESLHRNYLIKRGFNPEELIEKYQLKACYLTGEFKYRIIVPVILDGRTVNFLGMDVTGQAKYRYKNNSNDNAIIPIKSLLYNLDSVQNTALIVEGITDVWRMGDGTVATMSMEYTQEQILLLCRKKVKKAVVMFDGEELAIRKAYKLANALSAAIPVVEVFELPSGDPAELSEKEVKNIRQKIFEY